MNWNVARVLVLAGSLGPPLGADDGDDVASAIAIQRGKALDVAQLDPTLQSQSLGEWFFALAGPRTNYLQWTTIACGQSKDTDTGLCLRGTANWTEGKAFIAATVDVRVVAPKRKEWSDRPEVYEVSVDIVPAAGVSRRESESLADFQTDRTLSSLARLVKRASERAQGRLL